MSYQLQIRIRARKDIEKILDWYLERNKTAALKYQEQLQDNIEFILKHPLSMEIRYKTIRMSHLKNFPVSLHYSVNEKSEIILLYSVQFSMENPEKWV